MAIRVKSVQHLAIAVADLEPLRRSLKELFDISSNGQEVVEQQRVTTEFFQVGQLPVELLEPTTEESPISKFLQKRGNAMHHLALEVDDIDEALRFLKQKGVQLIDEQPREGAHGSRVAFLHPKAFHGLLVELVQTA